MCEHTKIIAVTEIPKGVINGRTYVQPTRYFVECADCGEILPITRITKEKRIVPLLKEPET